MESGKVLWEPIGIIMKNITKIWLGDTCLNLN